MTARPGIRIVALLLFSWLPLAGCGDSNRFSSTASYSYEYCHNCLTSDGECATACSFGGCTTGKRRASSFTEYCEMLRDDLSNGSCMREQRRRDFEGADCPGNF